MLLTSSGHRFAYRDLHLPQNKLSAVLNLDSPHQLKKSRCGHSSVHWMTILDQATTDYSIVSLPVGIVCTFYDTGRRTLPKNTQHGLPATSQQRQEQALLGLDTRSATAGAYSISKIH